jgi:two-component system NtrC family sensor kinase
MKNDSCILPEAGTPRYGSLMKLARKLAFAMIVGIALALSLHAVLGVLREIDLFETDSRNDELVLGRALGPAFARIWQLDGKRQALDLLQRVNAHEGTLRARWLPAERVPKLDDAHADTTDDGLIVVERSQDRDDTLFTYVPVVGSQGDKSVIELAESTHPRREYVRASLIRAGITAAGIASWCSLIAALLGIAMVGRPIRALVEQAQRIGTGDLEGRAPVMRRDEIGELAVEMNAMADRLGAARDKLAAETNARLGALNQLRHADRLATVGKLASGVAHELGTPLNVVAGRAKMIRTSAEAPEPVRRNARIVEEQADRMVHIIRQLLDFARAGQSSNERFDPKGLVEKTLTLVQPDADKHGVRLELKAPDELPVIEGDAGQIQQVLTNLLVNAIHAMREPGAVTVSLETRRESRGADDPKRPYLVLHVADEGVGMTPEVSARVFEPFFTTKDVGEGTGLGLSVAFGIVEEHGGFLEVETALGRGSRFSVHLPV